MIKSIAPQIDFRRSYIKKKSVCHLHSKSVIGKKRAMDGPWTDRRMDRPSYTDAWMHLKNGYQPTDQRTERQMDRPFYRNAWTHLTTLCSKRKFIFFTTPSSSRRDQTLTIAMKMLVLTISVTIAKENRQKR